MGLSDEKDDVRALLSGIGRVDAPADFEQTVRRRISQGQGVSMSRRTVFLLALKFAAPAIVLLVLGGFLVFFNNKAPDIAQFPEVIDTFSNAGNQKAAEPANEQAFRTSDRPVEPVTGNGNAAINKPASPKPGTKPKNTELGGGSEDLAVNAASGPLYPPGLDPNPKNIPTDPPAHGSVSLTSILEFLGIESACSSAACRVVSVRPASMAEKNGVQKDDLIYAIDGRPINTDQGYSGRIEFRSLGVNRGGRTITINLGSK